MHLISCIFLIAQLETWNDPHTSTLKLNVFKKVFSYVGTWYMSSWFHIFNTFAFLNSFFYQQDEKNQIITTNVWLNLVSNIQTENCFTLGLYFEEEKTSYCIQTGDETIILYSKDLVIKETRPWLDSRFFEHLLLKYYTGVLLRKLCFSCFFDVFTNSFLCFLLSFFWWSKTSRIHSGQIELSFFAKYFPLQCAL